MKVGLVCPYDVDVHGGVQRHVLELAETLRTGGDDVSVLAPGVPGNAGEDLTKIGPGLRVPFNGSIARVRMGPLSGRLVRTWLDEGEFDVVHIHEPFTPSVSVHALWGATSPIIATFHTAQDTPRLLRMSSKTVLRSGMGRVKASIAVSEEAKRTLEAYSDIEARVIPNGVRIGEFERALDDPVEPRDGTIRILFVGRVDEPRKGLQVLLDALPLIASRHPYAVLDVIGTGRPPRLPRGRGGSLQVRFHGPQPDDFKERMLRSADLFVAPNTYGESFGIVLVEAMAAGSAVVASDLPAFEAVLDGGKYGLTFPAGSHAGLAAAVNRALDDPSSTAIRTEAAKENVRRFDWSIVAAEIRSIYEGCMADSLT